MLIKHDTLIAMVLADVLLLASPLSGFGIRYEGKVAFGVLPAAQTRVVNAWVSDSGSQATLAVDRFFGDGSALNVRCSNHTADGRFEPAIEVAGRNDSIVTFRSDSSLGILGVPLPAHVCDYDDNGLQDLKFVLYAGGNAGNSNNGNVYYLFQHEREWWLVSFFIRDVSYTWECDLDGDGKFELLKGHHQDKVKLGYHDHEADKWIGQVFRKYLFINAYSLDANGLRLCNDLSDQFPMILPFTSDPFDVSHDKEFLSYNQFELPDRYQFIKAPLRSTFSQPLLQAAPDIPPKSITHPTTEKLRALNRRVVYAVVIVGIALLGFVFIRFRRFHSP